MKRRSKKKLRRRLQRERKNTPRQHASASIGNRVTAKQVREALPVLELDEQEIAPVLEGYGETSLARAKTYWFFGEWDRLVALGTKSLHMLADRDRFALLIASAYEQLGRHEEARHYTQMALDWGCPPRVVAQVLIAGVHNTLGKVAALKQDESRIARHFDASVAAIGTRDAPLASHARAVREMARIGLLPQAASLVDQQLMNAYGGERKTGHQATQLKVLKEEIDLLRQELSRTQDASNSTQGRKRYVERTGSETKGTIEPEVAIYSDEAYRYYQKLSQEIGEQGCPPFILLDSKSLPRSGLHYLKNTLARLLHGNFSFCEWYQEPGCCKKMPCALTGYPEQCVRSKSFGIRLIKSHDFNLTDPKYAPVFSVRRVILIRNPLFLLTSYFTLDQLSNYKQALKEKGVGIEKIWLAHESQVLEMAYCILDREFVAPDTDTLDKWLSEKTRYVIGFINKWVRPVAEKPHPYEQVIRYEDINKFIANMLGETIELLPEEAKRRVDIYMKSNAVQFNARKDPYKVASERLSAYLHENADSFVDAARKIAAVGISMDLDYDELR